MKELLLITIINILVINHTDFISSVRNGLKTLTGITFHLKPFSCPLCATFWSCVVYLLITSNLSLYTLSMSLILATQADNISALYHGITDAIAKLIRRIFF